MADDLESAVARHYGVAGLTERILAGIAAAGLDANRLKPEDLAPIDEFHIGGRAATAHVVGKLPLAASSHLLDIGCGMGGATRYVASKAGCRVTGIDLTPDYIAAAQELTKRTGLADRITYTVGSALDLPYATGGFDAALTIHVAMNINDRARLYAEAARVLVPGATFAIYDVMRGAGAEPAYPMPWAETSATSHLETPQSMAALLDTAGFTIHETEDRTAQGIAFFRDRLIAAATGPPPPLGLHLVLGATGREKFQNLLAGLERGAVAPVVMIARRAG